MCWTVCEVDSCPTVCYEVIVSLFLVVDGGAEVCGREERLAVEGVLGQVAGDRHAVQGAALGPGPVLPAPPAHGEVRTTSAFTFKTLLRHYAKQASYSRPSLMIILLRMAKGLKA